MGIIGENIKKLRAEQGITQKQLADAVNVSFQAVSKWENGEGVPDTMLLPLIAGGFDITIDELFRASTKRCANRAERLLAVYERTGRLEDFLRADFEFHKQLESNPELGLFRSYGVLWQYLAENSIKKALEQFNHVLDEGVQDSIYFRTLRQRMSLMARTGKVKECVAYVERLAEQREKNGADKEVESGEKTAWYECLMYAYYLDAQYVQVERIFLEARERGMESDVLYCLAGDAYRALKQYDQAFVCWERAMEFGGQYIDALWSMAFCYQELGDKANEKKTWEKILAWQSKEGLEEENIFVRKMITNLKEA